MAENGSSRRTWRPRSHSLGRIIIRGHHVWRLEYGAPVGVNYALTSQNAAISSRMLNRGFREDPYETV